METNYINPHRGEGEFWLLYTNQEGESFSVIGTTPDEYIRILERGYFERRTGDREPDRIYPAFVMLVQAIDGYDFLIRRLNQQNAQA